MDRLRITVFFEDPFWTVVFERYSLHQLTVARHVFGAQPTDPELYAWLLREFDGLVFSPAAGYAPFDTRSHHPQRRRREARRAVAQTGVGTWAQRALQQQRENVKKEKRVKHRAAREAETRRKYALRREKQKARHQGH